MISGLGFNRRTVDSGMLFLTKELEKLDTSILEPLTSVTYARDMPIRSGGGIVEDIRQIAVNYGTAGASEGEQSIMGGQTNAIPIMEADLSEDRWKTYIFTEILKIGFFDDMKMQKVGRSLQEMLDNGIHLHYDKYLDKNVSIAQGEKKFVLDIENAIENKVISRSNIDFIDGKENEIDVYYI